MKLEIESIETSLMSKVEKLKNVLSTLDEAVNTITDGVQGASTELNELKNTNSTFKSESNTLIEEASSLESKLKEKTDLITSNEEMISGIKQEKKEVDTQMANAEKSREELKTKNYKIEKDIETLRADLVGAETIYEEKVKSIEDEILSISNTKERERDQYKILKVLLEETYIKSPFYDVCKVINQAGMTSRDQLVRASAVDAKSVEVTLNELDTRGLIDYNVSEGTFSILKELKV